MPVATVREQIISSLTNIAGLCAISAHKVNVVAVVAVSSFSPDRAGAIRIRNVVAKIVGRLFDTSRAGVHLIDGFNIKIAESDSLTDPVAVQRQIRIIQSDGFLAVLRNVSCSVHIMKK